MSGTTHTDLHFRAESPLREFAKETGRARSLGFRVARNTPQETDRTAQPPPENQPPKTKSTNLPTPPDNQQASNEITPPPQALAEITTPPWFKSPKPLKNRTIDPGKSIFGCAYGSSVDDVIQILGAPTCHIKDGTSSSELVYGSDCILYFDDGKLCGVSIEDKENITFITDSQSMQFAAPSSSYTVNTYWGGWKLSNGIHPMMELNKARESLPDNYDEMRKSFAISDQNVSFQTKNVRNRDYIQSIKVLPASFVPPQRRGGRLQTDLNFLWANPSRSIANCPLGATKSEIIDKIGPPIATLDLEQKREALLYDDGMTLLLLVEDKLAGGDFRSTSHRQDENPFQLSNGIHLGMPLSKAKEILGDKLEPIYSNSLSLMRYADGPSLVSISSESDWSPYYFSNRSVIDSYVIASIKIDPIPNPLNKN